MLNKLAYTITQYPKTILLGVGLFTLFALVGLTKVHISTDFDIRIPSDDPISLSHNQVKEHFGMAKDFWIGIKSDNIFQTTTLEQIQSITEAFKAMDGVIAEEVVSLTTVDNIKGVEEGIVIGPYINDIPSSEAEFQALATTIQKDNLLSGQVVSANGRFTVIGGQLGEDEDTKAAFATLQQIKAAQPNAADIYIAGPFTQLEQLNQGIQKDINLLIPLALLLILIGYYLTFRTWRGVWLPFSMVILSMIWLFGIQGWLGIPISLISSTLPLLMVAVSSSYGIHLLHRYYEDILENNAKIGTKKALIQIGPALLMTGITSALGTLTLLLFKVGLIREFGLLATIGMLVVVVLSLTYMPALLSLLKKQTNPSLITSIHVSSWWTKIAQIAIQFRYAIIVIMVFILGVSIVGITKIKMGQDLAHYFQKGHPVNQSYNAFNSHLNGSFSIEVMMDTGVPGGVKNPMALKEAQAFQQYAEALPNVGTANSFVDVIKRMNQEFHASNPDSLRIPNTPEKVSQFMLLYSLSTSPDNFSRLIDYDYQRMKIKVMLRASKQDEHLALLKQLQQYQPRYLSQGFNLEFGGKAVESLAFIRYIIEGKIINMIAAIFVVFCFCSLLFRTIKLGLIAVVPLMFSMVTTLGIMGFLGIRLELATAVITAIGVGIGIDFAIHFIMRFRKELLQTTDFYTATLQTMTTAGRAISFDVLSNILGFSVLLFSTLQPIRNFGSLVTIMMLTVAISTFLLVPAILMIFSKQKRE